VDEQRFDEFTREMAKPRSRRSFLKKLAAGIFAGTAGGLGAEAASAKGKPDPGHGHHDHHKPCKRRGKKCKNNRQCCSGLTCNGNGICSSGCRIGGQDYAPGPHPSDPCLTCAPEVSSTSWTVNVGATCGEGDACTSESICQSDGSCAGSPVQPSIQCPGDLWAEANSGTCGAPVAFEATSECGAVTCSRASGDTFDVGATVVDCFAESEAGRADCSFTITVTDAFAPSITCPGDIWVISGGIEPAQVDFEATASDNCSSVSVDCSPPSGSFFPIGWTQVTCTATDSGSQSSTCQFNVEVTCQPFCSSGLCGESDGCGGYCYGYCDNSSQGACYTVECDTNAGACVAVNYPQGTDCQDVCTVGATCDGFGSCTGGAPLECVQDWDPCLATTGHCEPDYGCVFEPLPEGTICAEPTDLCTPSICNANGSCEQIVVTCSDDGCQYCDPTQGFCVNRDDNTPCGGGGGVCLGGACEPV
jgi:hypothetical protein